MQAYSFQLSVYCFYDHQEIMKTFLFQIHNEGNKRYSEFQTKNISLSPYHCRIDNRSL